MFIWNSRHTHRYPVSEIKSIGPYREGPEDGRSYLSVAKMKDGNEVVVYDSDIEKLMPETSYLGALTAEPGYSLLGVCIDEEPAWIRRTPVVAWLVTHTGDLVPATLAGPWDDLKDDQPIEHPDGRVYHPSEMGEYASVTDMIVEMRAGKERRSAVAAIEAVAEGPVS